MKRHVFFVELLKLSTAFLEDNEMRKTAKVASTTVKSFSTFTKKINGRFICKHH